MLRGTLEWRQQNDVGERLDMCDRLVAPAHRQEQQASSGCAHPHRHVIVMPRLGQLMNDSFKQQLLASLLL